MSRRNKLIIISVLTVVVIALVVLIVMLFLRNQAPVVTENPSEVNVPGVLPSSSQGKPTTTASPDDAIKASLIATASSFAERFSSFSNQGDFKNLNDLKSVMTLRMRNWTQDFIASQPKPNSEADYYGVTGKAITTKIVSLDSSLGQAEVVVTIQKAETKVTTINPKISYQDLRLEMINDAGQWKVDLAEWL